MFLQRFGGFYTVVDDFHEGIGISLEGALLVKTLQVPCDLLYLLLNAVPPSVTRTEKFHLIGIKLSKIKSFVLFTNGYVLKSFKFLVICGRSYWIQIYI